MHVLILSDTFPNRVDPWRGPYNRRQMECLARHCRLTVVNPLPWHRTLPGRRWHGLASGGDDVLDGIPLFHPRLWYVPVAGRGRTWRGVLAAARRTLRNQSLGPFDALLATFVYPHGMAAKALSAELGIPYVVKARGTDLHSLPAGSARERRAAEAVAGASAIVAVSRNLAEIAVRLGAEPARVHLLPNGVDADRFPTMPRAAARERVGTEVAGSIVAFVGDLRRVKGVDILVDSLTDLPHCEGARVVVIGDGPLRKWLERRAAAGSGWRIEMKGQLPRADVALWLNAADVLVVPSRNEGCPNVILEALSCGTPVVASRVGAVPDLLDEDCGIMVEPEDRGALSRAIHAALSREWDRAAIRRRVEGMSWEANACRLHGILAGAGQGGPQP